MSPGAALMAALGDLYRQSWRLLLLNAALSAATVPLLVAALWVPVALLPAVLVGGPLSLALMHCAVTLAETEEMSLSCVRTGLRLHWRRGLAVGATSGLAALVGAVALVAYARSGLWPLVALIAYLLAALVLFLMALLPLAVLAPATPLRIVARQAVEVVIRHPMQGFVLLISLVAVNTLAAAAALLPLLTLTVSYSFLAAAHFTLSRRPSPEAAL